MARAKKQSAETKRKLKKQRNLEKHAKILEEQKKCIAKKNEEIKEKTKQNQNKFLSNPVNQKKRKDQKTEKRKDPKNLEIGLQNIAKKRLDPDFHNKEKQQKKETYQINKSQNSDLYVKKKQEHNESMIEKRLAREFVEKENEQAKERMANKRKQIEPVVDLNKRIKLGSAAFDKFRLAIKEGPDVVCTCCKRLWFQTSCLTLDRPKLELKFGIKFCDDIFNNGASNIFCSSCVTTIRKKKVIPKFCANNYDVVFKIPNELQKLTILEERLVALRIPFMQIQSVGFNQQCSIKGQIVNVPLNLDSITDVLPRNLDETQTIQMKLMRKMEYAQAYKHETIRPAKVLKALDYLIKRPLYIEHNVKRDNDWEQNLVKFVSQHSATKIDVDNKQYSPIDADQLRTPESMDSEINAAVMLGLEQVPFPVDNVDGNTKRDNDWEQNLLKFVSQHSATNFDHPDNKRYSPIDADQLRTPESMDSEINAAVMLGLEQEPLPVDNVDSNTKRDDDWQQNLLKFVSQHSATKIDANNKQYSPIDIDQLRTPESMDSEINAAVMLGLAQEPWPVDNIDIIHSLSELSILNHLKKPIDDTVPSILPSKKNDDIWADENLLDNPEPVNPGGQETLLDNDELDNICFAPGEKNRPIHLMLDPYAEELSFPTLFAGEKKNISNTFSYSDQCKIQAQSMDRRFARTDFVLYMSKKLQLLSLVNAVGIALRKRVNQPGEYTAGELRNPDEVNKLIRNDAGYMFLNKIRSSPAYWKNEQTKLLSMVRQFNIPTIFLTITAAESRWAELIVILVHLVDDKIITEDVALKLSYAERVRLIRSDPITCARYFDHRFRLLFKHLKSNEGPFKTNPIEHYYYRTEFQHRGSPHIHALLWLTDAPKYDAHNPESSKICSEFADRFITCNKNLVSVQDIIEFNIHTHSKSCRREIRGKYMCRYGIPYLPMDLTTILEPIEPKTDELLGTMKDQYQKIVDLLNTDNNLTFDDFLKKLKLTKEDYLSTLQHCIKKPTMYVKRSPDECFVNHFNEEIFSMQKSNMDIQFILDPYACCKYIVSYINKSERGISALLREVVSEIKKGNMDLKQQLKKIAGVFLNASEISAQEAAYNVLRLPLHQTCTGYTFINTKPINKRVRMLKSLKTLKTLPPNTTNIYVDGIIEHYPQRPDDMSDICLAEFAAHWQFKSSTIVGNDDKELKDGGFIHFKSHANIISFCHYGLQQDPLNYYREQLMLYLPWRYEVDEIENSDQELLFSVHSDIILANRAKFDKLDSKILDEALLRAEEREVDIFDAVVGQKIDDEFMAYAVDDPEFDAFNIIDQPQNGTTEMRTYPTPFQLSDDQYDELIASLNRKQYEFLNHALDCITNHQQTCFSVIGGAAGCGKSLLISTLFQSLLRYYNSQPGNDPDTIKVLLTAPTGKAAFSIEGATLHSALSLPVSKSYEELLPLSNDTVNSIYSRLCHLKLLIIDEYSMVGCRMFDHINKRLQQLFKSKDPFGGISVILFGDLRQLSPVGDKWIFEPLKNNPYYAICGSHLWDMFNYFELTEIMRQRDDKKFAIALNHMANGIMTADDIDLIKSRKVTDADALPENIIHLFKSNLEVDAFNEQKLAALDTESIINVATDIVKGSCSERLKQFYLKSVLALKKSDCYGLMVSLRLQVGAKYMVSINVDTADGIVNGATGLLKQIDYDGDRNAKRCWIHFFETRSGKACRLKHAGYMTGNGIPSTWTPIEKCAKALQVKKGSHVMVERSQFPLQVSEGITVHKSQGATYQQVAVHLKKGNTRNAVYVACSRATSLGGLYIFGDFIAPKMPTEKDKSAGELRNLQENKSLNTVFNMQYVASENKQTLIFQNVQSLLKHVQLIKNNPIFINADILMFVETWLNEADSIEFENFECFFKICNTTSRKPYGISCYRKMHTYTTVSNAKSYLKTVGFVTFQAIIFTCNNICIIVVYIPPKLAIREALNCLQELVIDNRPTIILGDFNQDLSVGTSNCLIQFLLSKQFASQIDTNHATTKAKTHIDWCFSNVNRFKTHIYPTVYSHHHAIAVNLYETNIANTSFTDYKQKPSIVRNVGNYQIKQYRYDDDNMSVQAYDDDVPMDDFDDSFVVMDDNVNNNNNNNNNIIQPMVGLRNSDGVSCYANAAVQCLLSIMEIRPLLNNYRNPPISDLDNIKMALHNILIGNNSNCYELRRFVGAEYALREQNDAHLFLLSIIDKLERNEDSLGYFRFSFLPNTIHCINCDTEILGNEMPNSTSYNLYFPENAPPLMAFSRMFEPQRTDQQCGMCQSNNCTTKSTLLLVSNYLLVRLQRLQTRRDGTLYIVQTKFNRFDEDLVIIDEIMFRVRAVGIHLSSNNPNNVNQGHYIAHVRYNDEWWVFNDNQVKRIRFDQSLSNVTFLLLEKIS